VVVVCLLVVFAPGAPARADDPPPSDSGVIQYTELVPTSGGLEAPGVGTKRKAPLSQKAKRSLRKASPTTAKALEEVATSSDYGAPAVQPDPVLPDPVQPDPRRPREPRTAPAPKETPPSLERTISATAAAVAPVGDARMIGLLIGLVGIAAGAAVLAARARQA
jgi:hypothetical protein